MTVSLCIVIPAYNEALRIGKTLRQIFAYLNEHEGSSEVLVVDDGSDDNTVQITEDSFAAMRGRVQARLIPIRTNRGKGNAVRAGLSAARARVALFSDADLSTPITEARKLIAPLRAGRYDVVFGSRALDRKLIGVRQPWIKQERSFLPILPWPRATA